MVNSGFPDSVDLIVMQFQGSLADLRRSLHLTDPVDLRPEGTSALLKSPDYITVNAQNDRIATTTTFNDGRLKLSQQMWDAVTGKLLWKHEQLFFSGWQSYPGFTHDGQYVGFYDEDRIHLVHSYSPANFATILVSTMANENRGSLPKTRPILAFALANGGRRIAVAWRRNSQSSALTKTIAGERSIDMISVTDDQESPQICYSPDGTRIFVVYRRWLQRFFKSNIPIVVVDCFDVTAPSRKPQRVRIEDDAVASYRFGGGMTTSGMIVLDVNFHVYLSERDGGGKRFAVAISSTGKKSYFPFDGWSEIIVSNGSVLGINSNGVVKEPYYSLVASAFKRVEYPGCSVVAANIEDPTSARVTILSRQGELLSISLVSTAY